MGKISFEKLYRSIVKGFDETPPESVWQNIQDELDIEDVWNQIDQQLPAEPANPHVFTTRKLINYVLFFSLLFFFNDSPKLSLLSVKSTHTNSSQSKTLVLDKSLKEERHNHVSATQNNMTSEAKTNDVTVEANSSNAQTNKIDPSKITKNLAGTNKQQTVDYASTAQQNDILNKNEISSNSTTNAPLHPLTPRGIIFDSILINLSLPIATIDSTESANTVEEDRKTPFIRLSSVGLVGAIKNSWIINNNTRAAFNNETLITTEATYTHDYGISAQLISRTKQVLQLSYYFTSKSSQNYHQYYNASYTKKEFSIMQQTFAADILQPVFSSQTYLMIGFQFGKINKVEQTLAGNVSDLSDEYSDWNYGIDLGLQKKFDLHSKFSFQPAIRLHYGLNNIFKGNRSIPKKFNVTRTTFISLDLRFFYHFKK